jgi:hypothetical protein
MYRPEQQARVCLFVSIVQVCVLAHRVRFLFVQLLEQGFDLDTAKTEIKNRFTDFAKTHIYRSYSFNPCSCFGYIIN